MIRHEKACLSGFRKLVQIRPPRALQLDDGTRLSRGGEHSTGRARNVIAPVQSAAQKSLRRTPPHASLLCASKTFENVQILQERFPETFRNVRPTPCMEWPGAPRRSGRGARGRPRFGGDAASPSRQRPSEGAGHLRGEARPHVEPRLRSAETCTWRTFWARPSWLPGRAASASEGSAKSERSA